MLSIILISFYFLFIIKLNNERGFNLDPLSGLIYGVFYFTLCPFFIVNLDGGFTLPIEKGAKGYWAEVNLNIVGMQRSGFVIKSLLVEFLVVCHICLMQISIERQKVRNLPFDIDKTFNICVGLVVGGLILQVFSEGGVFASFENHWYTRHEVHFDQFGTLYVWYLRLADANSAVLTAVSACLIRGILIKRDITFKTLRTSVVILVSQALVLITTGNRIYIAILGIITLSILFSERRYWVLAKLIVSVPGLMFLGNVWARIRGNLLDIITGFDSYLNELPEGGAIIKESLFDGFEGTNVLFLFHIINDFGVKFDFFAGESYLRLLTSVIPREFYPDKMEPLTKVFADIYEPGEITSFSSTMFGELYSNFGLFTFFVLPVLVISVFKITVRWRVGLVYYPILGFIFTLWMTRSVFADNVVQFMISCLVLKIIINGKNYFSSTFSHKL